jgi:sugar/nucleoside kinase (ribokinase family)
MTPGVLCSGSLVYDTLVRPVEDAAWGTTTFVETIEYHPGGNGANTSLALAVLGTPVKLLGAVGNDAPGNFVLNRLTEAGVDTTGVCRSTAPTAASIVIVNGAGDRKFLHHPGASRHAFTDPPQFNSESIEGVSHYHLASLFVLPGLRRQAPAILKLARAAGLTTSLDINWDPEGRWMIDLAPCLPHLDILFVNEDESRMCTGTAIPKEAARIFLGTGLHTAVLKLGSKGCAIYTEDSEHLCPAFEVEAKDTTGAGDCFAAGFLAATLRNSPLNEAGRFANAVAALSVQNVGATVGVKPWNEVKVWLTNPKL